MTGTHIPRKPNRRECKAAKELLRTGTKVWLYKKDKLAPIEERALRIALDGLKDALKEKNTPAEVLEKKARILDEALRKSGGHFYHKKNWVEKSRSSPQRFRYPECFNRAEVLHDQNFPPGETGLSVS